MNYNKTVVLYHIGKWYKVYGDGAYVLSYLTNYKLFEDPKNEIPTVGFPDYLIDKIIEVLRENKINYVLKLDDDVIIDYKEENNFEKFLFHSLPFSFIKRKNNIKSNPKGYFKVQFENEKPETFIIGKNINKDAELVNTVINSKEGDVIKINEINVKIISKNIN